MRSLCIACRSKAFLKAIISNTLNLHWPWTIILWWVISNQTDTEESVGKDNLFLTRPLYSSFRVMPHTQEYYHFKGKFSIVSSPLQLTRYPPPKISEKEDYWENQRIELWHALDEKTRTTFSWPPRGDTPRAHYIPLETVSEQAAMDNFCLLIYKITEVEHLDHSTFPPKRMVNGMSYQTSFKAFTLNSIAIYPPSQIQSVESGHGESLKQSK